MPDNNIFGVDFVARCLAGEGLDTANRRQWKLQAGPRILLSDNPATQTTTISASGDEITVDSELSSSSENPVQNKVITNALSYKPDTVINGGTKVANQKIMQLTRQQYDAIQDKDTNTYYMITDDMSDYQYTAGTGINITNNVISLSARYGATIELDVNTSTYVVTATLRDQSNNVLSTDTIDLPLESVVVNGSYDSATDKIILTLQNGNTIEFSVASLVSGLEETSNKVSSITNASTNTEYPSAAAVYSFVTGQSYDEVPDVTSSDDGKILTATYSGGTGSYAWTSPQTFSQQQADWTEADSSAVDYIKNKPNLAAVATSGSYTDLSDKPSIPAAQVNADWNSSSGVSEILNKPTLGTAAAASTTDFATAAQGALADTAVQPADLATVATSGSYTDLSNTPTIPAAQVNADWNSSSGVSEILNKPSLATVATSGSYNDLINTPTIPAAQIQSDWNQTNNQALDYIKNKPNIPAAQVNSDWSAASGVSQILNKPDLSIYLTSSDLSGYATETYVNGKVPNTTQYDEGKYLTVGSNGNEWALIDEVPDIGSSDDGKVLTAAYSGGVGTYSWQPAGGYTLPYASQSTKGGIRAWTTVESGETVLNIATEDPV